MRDEASDARRHDGDQARGEAAPQPVGYVLSDGGAVHAGPDGPWPTVAALRNACGEGGEVLACYDAGDAPVGPGTGMLWQTEPWQTGERVWVHDDDPPQWRWDAHGPDTYVTVPHERRLEPKSEPDDLPDRLRGYAGVASVLTALGPEAARVMMEAADELERLRGRREA